MFRSCSVVNCTSKRKDVTLFKFPNRQVLLQKWLDCINCEELRNKRTEDLYKRFVCQKHFQQKFIITTRTGRTHLHVDAYPTLFSDSEISSGTPKTQSTYIDHTDIVFSEHTYTRKKEHEDHTYYYKLESTRNYERIITEIDAENKESEKDENKENEYEVNNEHQSEEIKEHVDEENKEIENQEHKETDEEADYTSFENTDLVDYVTTWTDDMPSSSGCVNEAPEHQIAKDSIITSIVPSTPKLKARRRAANNKKSLKAQPKKGKKSSPNCATTVIKSPRQLKLNHRTDNKLDMSKAKSFKKVSDRMNPLAKEIMWMHECEANKETENEEHKETENEAYITSFEDTDLVNYVTTWTDDMPLTSGCVNEAPENPIIKDADNTSIVPSTAKLKVRKRRVDNKKTNQKDQPKKVKKSSPNSAIPVSKSLRQLKHCHKTARKINLSKTRSFKKVTDSMDPLAKDIMWMLIEQCAKKGLSAEERHNTLFTLKQVQSVTESCINFLSSQESNKQDGLKLETRDEIPAQQRYLLVRSSQLKELGNS